MRLILLTFLMMLFTGMGGSTAQADGYKYPDKGFEAIQNEIKRKRKLFDKAVNHCLYEIHNDSSYEDYHAHGDYSNDGTALVRECLSKKGVKLHDTELNNWQPKVTRMGDRSLAGKNSSVLTYDIPDVEVLKQRLTGKVTVPEDGNDQQAAPQQFIPPSAPAEPQVQEPAQEQYTEESSSGQKEPSVRPKYYLPSKKAGEGSPSIFLKR